MPQIKQYAQQSGPLSAPRNIPHPSVVVDPGIGRGVSDLGTGIMNLARGLQYKEEEDGKAWSAGAISKARVDWAEELEKRKAQAEPGAPAFTSEALSGYDEYVSKIIETAPSESAKAFANQRFSALRAEVGTHAITFEAQAGVDFRTDLYTRGVENSKRLMNTDPDQYGVVLAEQLAILSASDIPPIKKSSLEQKAINEISQAAVWSQIQRSPTEFLGSIGFYSDAKKTRPSAGDLTGRTGNLAFDALPFDSRTRMFNQAIQMKNQIDMDADRLTKDRFSGLEADAMKEAWSRQIDGKLTRAYVEEIRPIITAQNYHSLLTAMRGGAPTVSDKQSVYMVETTLQRDPAEAIRLANSYFNKGLLEQGYYVGILGRAHTQDRQGGPKTEYEMSRGYIQGQLDPGPLVQDPIARGRMADALDTFDRWINAGKRSDEDVRKRGREIVNQYKFINLSDQVFALPSPRSGQIRRNPGDPTGMLEDIAKAARRAQELRDKKVLTPAEYEDEMSIMARWKRQIEEQSRVK